MVPFWIAAISPSARGADALRGMLGEGDILGKPDDLGDDLGVFLRVVDAPLPRDLGACH